MTCADKVRQKTRYLPKLYYLQTTMPPLRRGAQILVRNHESLANHHLKMTGEKMPQQGSFQRIEIRKLGTLG